MKVGEFEVESGDGTVTLRRTGPRWLPRIRLAIALTLVTIAALGSFLPEPIVTLVTLLLGSTTVATALMRAVEIAGRGALQAVSSSVIVRRKETGQYREGATKELVVDDEVFDASRVTKVEVRGVLTNNKTIWNLYLVLQDRAFKVAASAVGEPIDALATALRDALEVGPPEADHAREPVSLGAVGVLVVFAMVHVAFVTIATVVPTASRGPHSPFMLAFGPIAVLACEPVFAWVVGYGTRGLVRAHAKRMLGFT